MCDDDAAYYLAGMSLWIFLRALAGLFSILPVSDTALAWVPGHPLLIAQQRAPKGVILTGVDAGLVGLMDNLLQPLLVGGQARLPVLPCS